METRRHHGPTGPPLNSEINITPLVDVMLVVLIIFIVVTPLLQHGMTVDLPAARHVADASVDRHTALTVAIQNDGQLYLESDPLPSGDLYAVLVAAHTRFPQRPLQIKADRNVPYRRVKEVLQAGRQAGFRDVALIAQETSARTRGD